MDSIRSIIMFIHIINEGAQAKNKHHQVLKCPSADTFLLLKIICNQFTSLYKKKIF